jgi:adenylosuccinate synthase
MTKAYAVIGSGYGDEGKGLFTDYLSNFLGSSIVVRHNGGAQAGHTVTVGENRHVFGHFGSNSFIDNATTFLSSHFVLNPILFLQEKEQLDKLGLSPKVMAHEDCYITTPFDMVLNQWVEDQRAGKRHGSCGVGFGETIARSETPGFNFQLKDIHDTNLIKEKLIHIRENYFMPRVIELGLEEYVNDNWNAWINGERFLDKYISDLQKAYSDISITQDKLPTPDLQEDLVFEGAQGLMLDQKLGAFPYVTRSNTGMKNIIDLLTGGEINELEVVYATRCYTTRHGAGPLSNPLEDKPYEKIQDITNIPNQFQGTLRVSYLDLDILKDIIKNDQESVVIPKNLKVTYKLGISCLDQTEKVSFYENKELKELPVDQFIEHMKKTFNMKTLGSFGPTRTTIQEYN